MKKNDKKQIAAQIRQKVNILLPMLQKAKQLGLRVSCIIDTDDNIEKQIHVKIIQEINY